MMPRAHMIYQTRAQEQREGNVDWLGSWPLAILLSLLGILAGVRVARHYYLRGGGRRSELQIDLCEVSRIDPVGMGIDLQMRIGTYSVTNLSVLEVQIVNSGPRDIVVHDASDPDTHDLRPFFVLPKGWRALADPWNVDRVEPSADVRLARYLADGQQAVSVHLRRLATGRSMKARVICHYRDANPIPVLDHVSFQSGFLPDTDVVGTGLLASKR